MYPVRQLRHGQRQREGPGQLRRAVQTHDPVDERQVPQVEAGRALAQVYQRLAGEGLRCQAAAVGATEHEDHRAGLDQQAVDEHIRHQIGDAAEPYGR